MLTIELADGTLAAEAKRMEKYIEKEKKAGRHEIDQIPMKKLFPLLGPKSLFYRVFLDEAQCIKNKNTQSARAACTVKSIYRFCLTGTPSMQALEHFISLFARFAGLLTVLNVPRVLGHSKRAYQLAKRLDFLLKQR
jgi:SNF2 family DNA or RNA helicase